MYARDVRSNTQPIAISGAHCAGSDRHISCSCSAPYADPALAARASAGARAGL